MVNSGELRNRSNTIQKAWNFTSKTRASTPRSKLYFYLESAITLKTTRERQELAHEEALKEELEEERVKMDTVVIAQYCTVST